MASCRNATVRVAILEIVSAMAGQLADDLTKEMKKKKRVWVRPWIERRMLLGASQNLVNELRMEDPLDFKNLFRMSASQFEELLVKVAPKIQKQDTMMRIAISPAIRLQVVLRYLATGDSFKSLEFLYRVPKCSISCFLLETLDAIYEVLQEYIKAPKSTEEWRSVMNDFAIKWNFPGCIGALDGKHILIRNPPDGGSDYYNYKGSYSIILLGLVDANYCFIYIDVGAQGRISDGGLFQESLLLQYLELDVLKNPPDIEDIDTGEILYGYWRQVTSATERLEMHGSNNYSREAAGIRNGYADYFMTSGAVPWQMDAIKF
ncbi:uncharacterized protein LOC134209404 [Armigeres subalbatus]|uniref:uncharacterized protein LOC134209404 n=1 Tax=Armigeres subalbatus TaxID=124917 RepID=UPI002ED5CBF1